MKKVGASNTTKQSLIRSTTANLAGVIIPLIVQLVTVPFYLQLIGIERYGALNLVWLLLGYFGLFDLGFGLAITSRIAGMHEQSAEARARVFWTGTALSVLTGVVGGLCLFTVGRLLFTDVFQLSAELQAESQAAMLWVALGLPVVTGISALSGALQGRQAFVAMNISQTTGLVLYQAAPLAIAAIASVTMPWLVAAAVAGRCVTAIMLLVYCLREVPASLPPRFARSEISAMIGYGGWVTVTAIVGPILTIFDRFVIGVIAGMNAVAVYSVPFNILMRASVLPTSLQNALFPRYAMASEEESRRLLSSSIRCQAWMMTPLVLTGILLIKPFLSLWIGVVFAAQAAPIGQILFLGLWFTALACVPYYLLQSRGRPDIPAKFHLVELCVYAPALWLLIDWMGVTGAAWAWDLRVALDMVLLFYAAHALAYVREARWGLIWVIVALGWALFDTADIALYYGGAAILFVGCGVWTWRSVPAEVMRILPIWPARLSR